MSSSLEFKKNLIYLEHFIWLDWVAPQATEDYGGRASAAVRTD